MHEKISNEYWAGLFDGEGSVSISNILRPSAHVSQKRTEVLFLLKSVFGGEVYSKGKGLRCSNWGVCKCEDVERFLNSIYPYLIIKEKEVKIILNLLPLIKRENKGCHPLTQEEKSVRLEARRTLQRERPNANFQDRPSARMVYREKIKTKCDNKCVDCKMDLTGNDFYAVIHNDNNLYCRRCHAKLWAKTRPPLKPFSKQEIEKVIGNSKSIKEAAKILGMSRCTLYHKRKLFGMFGQSVS